MTVSPDSPVAVITGAAGGIGRATVELFREEGWYVVGMDRRDANDAADRSIRVDLSDEADLRSAFSGLAELGRVDTLVNNAAVLLPRSLITTTTAEWSHVLDINLRAAFLTMQAAHPLLQARGGSVVNVSSVHALATTAGVAAYAASKGALVALTRAAAIEFAADGVRVNAVLPGAVDTPMLDRPDEPPERKQQIADRTPLGRTGEAIVVDGGTSARLGTE
jgi:NAD(P)-dependent dehydrogenase (short-subunit alcohol dehydrogenase family)